MLSAMFHLISLDNFHSAVPTRTGLPGKQIHSSLSWAGTSSSHDWLNGSHYSFCRRPIFRVQFPFKHSRDTYGEVRLLDTFVLALTTGNLIQRCGANINKCMCNLRKAIQDEELRRKGYRETNYSVCCYTQCIFIPNSNYSYYRTHPPSIHLEFTVYTPICMYVAQALIA